MTGSRAAEDEIMQDAYEERMAEIRAEIQAEEDARPKVTFSEILPLIGEGQTVAMVHRRNGYHDTKYYVRLADCSNFRNYIQFYVVPDCRWRAEMTHIWPEWFTDLKCWRPLTDFERAYHSRDPQ